MIIIYIFHNIFAYILNIFIIKVIDLVFYFIFLTRGNMQSFTICGRQFSNFKQYVGAGINTLMSISDGLGPSIFCRKMEKARPMREDMDGKVVYFPPESSFFTLI